MSQDDYGDGYAAGKAKGLFEAAIATSHFRVTPECRCAPCVGLRHAVYTMGKATPPVPKLGRCLGCGREGMVVNSVCPRCWG